MKLAKYTRRYSIGNGGNLLTKIVNVREPKYEWHYLYNNGVWYLVGYALGVGYRFGFWKQE